MDSFNTSDTDSAAIDENVSLSESWIVLAPVSVILGAMAFYLFII